MKYLTLLAFIFLSVTMASAQTDISGTWKGAIDIQGQQLAVIFKVKGEPENYSGTIDIPQQGAKDLTLTEITQNQDSVQFRFFTGSGDGIFEGVMTNPQTIEGTYRQGAASFPFKVEHKEELETAGIERGIGEELIIKHGAIDIGGTLVMPDNREGAPLVIMISGSGAQDRNSNVYDFKIFAEIAEYLKENGISSFRYDDRQVGKSTGSFADATLKVLADDVHAIIEHFQTDENRNFSKIVLLGHSQGGVVAGKVANENAAVNQLILMASTGVDLKRILRFQVKQAYGEGIHSEKQIEKEIALREEIMKAIRDEGDVEQAKKAYAKHYETMIQNLPEAQKSQIPDISAFANSQANQLEQVFGSPQTKSLLFYDPTQDLKELSIPVLVLFGEKDTQVPASLNKKTIEEALKSADTEFDIQTIAGANHLFQKAETGQASEYPLLDKAFAPGFLEILSEWILAH